MKYANNNSGYTLLEILLVLIILAGAASFLLLRIPHNIQEKAIELSSTRLAEELKEAQQEAIAGNVWYKVKFYTAVSEYKIFKQGEHRRTVHLPEGVCFGNKPPDLTILPTGAPVSGMTVNLKAGSYERNVIIAPVMGRIRVEIVR